ncbi:hypothetical protein HKX48_009480 [Thoreauomyces humboldtii]|nr:hypothetical protein HKX48_009480 [Thoreauomyces humboldtii]
MSGMPAMPSPQQQQSPNPGMPAFQGMSHSQFQAAAQFSQGGFTSQYHHHLPYHGNPNFQGPPDYNHTMRTIYLGNLPTLVTYEEVINLVKGGALEQVKILEEKNCAFITFIDATAAHAFHLESQGKRLSLGPQELKIGWGKSSALPNHVLSAVQGGASRNVFVGNIDDSVNESMLAQELGRFGPIDQIKILPEKRIAFVHMASVGAAMKAIQTLPSDARWVTRRINYGKDRCMYQPKRELGAGSSTRSTPPSTPGGGLVYGGSTPYGRQMAPYGNPLYNDQFNGMNASPGINRTIYLGAIHPDVTTKDLCDVIRGGILQNIKYMPDKNIAFVSFIDPAAALNFFNRGSSEGLVLKGKRLKIGWGKPSPLPAAVSVAVQAGASRNVYIGTIDDAVSEDRLRKDFGEFGDIELVNIIADKNIGFVNFVDLVSAVKAVEVFKNEESRGYGQYRINFGKDRCGNPPRPPRETAAQRAAAVAAAAAVGEAAAASLNVSLSSLAHGGSAPGAVAVPSAGQTIGGPGGLVVHPSDVLDENESLFGG